MATRYSIFPSIDSGSGDDRVYNAVDYLARPSQDFLAGEGDGVSREVGGSLEVTETSPASLAVSVATGVARANGYRFEVFTAAEEVALSTADATHPRIDRIVVQARLDSANRDMRLTVIEGTPAASPSAPALTRDSDTYEISLAQVLVGAGVSSVSDSEITDERGENDVCGWLRPQVSGITGVQSLDHDDLPLTIGVEDRNKTFIIDLSGATADETITLPAEATAGDGWGVRIRLTGLADGFKLNINNDAASAEWEMGVAGQLIHPVTDGTSWFNAEPGAILAETWLTASATHNYAAGAVLAEVYLTGGAAGGRTSNDSAGYSGGGGGAAETRHGLISGFGASETVTIGTGGAAETSGNNSSWGAFITANAGATAGGVAAQPGDGGDSGSGGDQGFGGQAGSPGELSSGSTGGSGGASYWGGGGAGGNGNSSGDAGTAPGSGGGGGGEGNGGGNKAGGTGADGVAHCVEYA